MNLKFWKKETAPEDGADGAREEPGDNPASRSAPGRDPRNQDTSRNIDGDGKAAVVSPAHPYRRLMIGAAIAVLISAVIGMASWKIFLASPNRDTARAETPTSMQPNPLAEKNVKLLGSIEFLQLRKAQFKGHQSDIEVLRKRNNELPPMEVSKVEPSQVENLPGTSRQAEIEILKKENDELQTQIGSLKAERSQDENPLSLSRQAEIEILRKKNDQLQTEIAGLRKKQQPDPSALTGNQVAGEAQAPTRGGDIAIGNKNPQATATTLKAAIEVMNANSGDPPRNAAR